MQFSRSIFLYVLLPVLCLVVARVLFGIDGLYGQDAYEYLRFTKELHAFWSGGVQPADFFWPVGYPFWGSLVAFVTSNEAIALQILSVAALIGSLIYLNEILKLHAANRTAIKFYLVACFLLSPLVLRLSWLCMSDMLCVFFIAAHLYHFMRYKAEGKPLDLFFVVVFAGSAVFTRYGAAVPLLFTSLLTVIYFFRKPGILRFAAGCAGVLLAVLPHFIFTSKGYFSFTDHPWLANWNAMNLFRSEFMTNDGEISYQLPNLLFYLLDLFHPRFFILLAPLVIYALVKKIRMWNAYLLVAACAYIIFLAGIPTQNSRFLLLASPYVVILLYPVFEHAWKAMPYRKYVATGLIIANLALVFFGSRTIYDRTRFEQEIVASLNSKYSGRNIYSFDIDQALTGRNYNGRVFSLYEKLYDDFRPGDLILFAPEKFAVQWKNKKPMQNWNRANADHELVVKETFDDGWKLYEIR